MHLFTQKNPAYLRRFLLLCFLFAGGSVSGQNLLPSGLMTMAENILDIFTGDLARIILGCCFAGSCIAYAYNKDNEKMKAKVLAVMVATGLLVLTSEVIDQLWSLT
jgi:hypothetical protein